MIINPSSTLQLTSFVQETLLDIPVKVDNHVAAQDYVKPLCDTEIGIHEIETAKTDFLPDLWGYQHQGALPVPASEEIFPFEICGTGATFSSS